MSNSPVRNALTGTAAMFILAACSTAAEPAPPATDDRIESVEHLISPWVSDDAPGVSVAISLNDELVFARGAGMANLEQSIPISPTSVFQVASVSKQFTAFATLLLVSEGKIELDEDIRTYLPDLPQTDTLITVRHLLDHTSGLRERGTLSAMAGWQEDDIRTQAQIRALVNRQNGVNFVAGTEIEYSNTGYGLLADLVEQVSGQDFHAFTKARIFDPLDMTQTQFPASRNALIVGRASSYYPDQNGFQNVIAANETTGSTGLYTTAIDLLKWAENFESKTVGDALVFELMAERFQAANGEDSTFAKGQELRAYKGFDTWSHGGTDAGYRSFLLRVPDQDLEISVLSNRTDFDKATFAFQLADIFLPAEDAAAQQANITWTAASAEELTAYEGFYELFPGVVFDLRAEDAGLTFAFRGAPRDGLEPLPQIGPREFLLNADPERTLIFDARVDGMASSLKYRLGMDGKLDAERVELAPFDAESIDLNAYTGRCESPELGTRYDLKLVDGTLMAEHVRIPNFALTPYQQDTFTGQGPLQKLEFERDLDGTISGFFASAPLAERVWFTCR